MSIQPDYQTYAAKMRHLVLSGTDMETEARFVDMLGGRNSRILDIGCGIGTTVNALRHQGHLAYGLDPTDAVLDVAYELYDPAWYRKISATNVNTDALNQAGLPPRFELILMSGNVPFFLTEQEFAQLLTRMKTLLTPGGLLVIGTTTVVRGGPRDQDASAPAAGLKLKQRYANWHLDEFLPSSPFSVSIFSTPGEPAPMSGPDGMYILRS